MGRGYCFVFLLTLASLKEVSNAGAGKVDGKTVLNMMTSYFCTGDTNWTDKVADPALRTLCATFKAAICDHNLPNLKTLLGWIQDIVLEGGRGRKFNKCLRRELETMIDKLFCKGEKSKIYMRSCLRFAKNWTCELPVVLLCPFTTFLYPKADQLVEDFSRFCQQPQGYTNPNREIKKRQYDVSSMIDLVRTMICREDVIRQVVGYIEDNIGSNFPGLTDMADLLSGAACCILDSIKD
ncbi:hypothetical protein ACHWQZ_G010011 [Mnemiopsis leidyi]